MIKQKKKSCRICKQPSFIWSKGCCKDCWQRAHGKPIKKEPAWIARQSEKGKERAKLYQKIRDVYFKEHPICERCGAKDNLDLHHKRGRDGDNLFQDFMTTCRECHRWIHENVLEAYKLGYLLSRLKKEDDEQE